MDAEHAEITRHFMHRERTGRGLGIDQKFAAIGVDEFARDPGRFLRLALGIADHHFDLPSRQPTRGVDLVDLDHHAVARRSSELGDTARKDRRHPNFDGLGLRARHPRCRKRHCAGAHQRQRRTPAYARLAGLGHLASSTSVRPSNPCRRSCRLHVWLRISEKVG